MRAYPLLIVAFTACLAGGCTSADRSGVLGRPAAFVQPTIAVMKFENRAAFPLSWDLGSGLQDVLVHRLVATGRYHVIERPEIDAVLRELKFQQSGLTREQEKAAPGEIKNVQYLVKGTITDFAHVATERGFLGLGAFGGSAGSSQAVMGMTMYVVDVQSGEIVCSESIQQTVHATDLNVAAAYKNVAFGGSVFYRTPLGQATNEVVQKAVARITDAIGSRPWRPRVAAVRDERAGGGVLLNGGRDRDLAPGREFEVMEAGAKVLDPDNGDVIGSEPGVPVGRVRVTEVMDRFSVAEIVAGRPESLRVGQMCRPAAAQQPAR